IEIARAIDHELDRPGRAILRGLGERNGLSAHAPARRRVEKRARRLLDHLLVAALDRAFALAEMNDVAMRVGEHLDLDMPRLGDVFLDEDAVIAEGRTRLARGEPQALAQGVVALRQPHALATAAGRGLD